MKLQFYIQVIETDPYWTPTTEEELELFGDKGDSVNRSQIYVNNWLHFSQTNK